MDDTNSLQKKFTKKVSERAKQVSISSTQNASKSRELKPSHELFVILGLMSHQLNQRILQDIHTRLRNVTSQLTDQGEIEKVVKRALVSHMQTLDSRKNILLQFPRSTNLESVGTKLFPLASILAKLFVSSNPLYHGGREPKDSLAERIELFHFMKEHNMEFEHIMTLGIEEETPLYFINGTLIHESPHEIVIEAESMCETPSGGLFCARFAKNKSVFDGEVIAQVGETSQELSRLNVVRLVEWFTDYHTGREVVMTEYHGVSLEQLVKGNPELPPKELLRIFEGIISGVSDLHKRGKIVGKLSPKSVMVEFNEKSQKVLSVKIDLLCAMISSKEKAEDGQNEEFTDPELLTWRTTSKKGDIYSVGAIIKYLLKECLHINADEAVSVLLDVGYKRINNIDSFDMKLLKEWIKEEMGEKWNDTKKDNASNEYIKHINKIHVLKKENKKLNNDVRERDSKILERESQIVERDENIKKLQSEIDLIKANKRRKMIVNKNENGAVGFKWPKITPQNMPYHVTYHSLLVYDSKVYITGGQGYLTGKYSYGENLDVVQEYSISTNSWRILPQRMTCALCDHSSCVVDGRLYNVRGCNNENHLSSFEVLDLMLTNGEWKSKNIYTGSGRSKLTCSGVQHKIFAIGGYTQVGSRNVQIVKYYDRVRRTIIQPEKIYGAMSEVEVYDTLKDSWTNATPVPSAIYGHQSVVIGTEIIVIGGNTTTSTYSDSVFKYDTQADKWTSMAPFPMTICGHATSALDDNTLVVSGGDNNLSSVYLMDLRANTWNKLAVQLQTGRTRHKQVSLDNNSFMVFGGSTSTYYADPLNSVEVVDIRC